MLKSSAFAAALTTVLAVLAASQGAIAATPVGAGGLMQEIPPAPAPEASIPDIRIDRGETARALGPAGPKVLVRSLRITGETLFSEANLIAVTGFSPGSQLDLRDLRQMAAKITDYYNRRGYFVAQAYVPAQDVTAGTVTIVVIEGRYGKIGLDNRTNLSNGLAKNVLGGLNSGAPVASAPLERRLLLLSDMPGVVVRSTLSPGAAVGTSDLNVALTPGQRITGSVEADNEGDPYSGAWRLGATVNLNEPTGHGDVASLRVLSSFDGLDYVRASYQFEVQDATFGVAYSALDYRLHGAFSALRASGTAEVASLYASYPVIRSYDNNLTAQAELDDMTFQDKVGATFSVTDKEALALSLGVRGDHHDPLGGGGWDQYALGWTSGDLDIETPAARIADDATARSNGQFGKLTFSASRLQTIVGPLSVYAVVRGQVASKNLDISEQMELGGPSAVRAYPEGEIYADEGYVATLEARLMLPRPPMSLPGRVQLIAFADYASATTNWHPWAPGPNRETLSGAGVGANWAAANNFIIKATCAHSLGQAVGIPGPAASSEVWIELVKLF
jgi:hemolysin activation/secretion protein